MYGDGGYHLSQSLPWRVANEKGTDEMASLSSMFPVRRPAGRTTFPGRSPSRHNPTAAGRRRRHPQGRSGAEEGIALDGAEHGGTDNRNYDFTEIRPPSKIAS